MTWIKLTIHPEHDKVLRLADLAESTPDAAFVAAVRWFRWVDAHVENAHTGISFVSFRVVVRWPDDKLALAMLHPSVDWMEKGRDGLLRPTRPDSHFSKSAKQRALTGKRVTQHRYDTVTKVTVQELLDQTRPEKTNTSGSNQQESAVDSGLAGWPDGNDWSRAVERGHIEGVLSAMGLREPLLSATAALPNLTVEEIVRVAKDVGGDRTVRLDTRRPVVVSDRLHKARKVERPREHRGGKATKAGASLSPDLMAEVGSLAEAIRKRGFKA